MALEEPERRAAPKRAGRESEPSSFAARTVPNDALLRIAAFFALFLVFVGFPCLAIITALGGTFAESHRHGDEAYHKGDYKEAMRWYRTAADEGDAIAQGNIGWLYQAGLGVPQDYEEAMRWYRMSVDNGSHEASRLIGGLYLDGLGVPRDYKEAMRWYRIAAEYGSAPAQNQIGWLYQNGFGVERDYEEAMRWFRKAADHGVARAEAHIGEFYANGLGVPRDDATARYWFKRAAARRDVGAQKWLAQHGDD